MLTIFKSDASGDVVMFEKNGKAILRLLGKNPEDPRGVVTVDQLPGALAAIKTAIAADKEMLRQTAGANGATHGAASGEITLSQRALPFQELLERSIKGKASVTWGV